MPSLTMPSTSPRQAFLLRRTFHDPYIHWALMAALCRHGFPATPDGLRQALEARVEDREEWYEGEKDIIRIARRKLEND